MDDSAALAIEQFMHSAMDEDSVCIGLGFKEDVADVLQSLMVLREIPKEKGIMGLTTHRNQRGFA